MSSRPASVLLKRKSRRSGLAVSICICRCAIVRWEKKAGVRARRKTSAAPDCCSRRRNCSIRMPNWRSAWCCRRKLPDSAATEVICRGEVVRSVEAQGQGVTPALAAKILQYHFQHGTHVRRSIAFGVKLCPRLDTCVGKSLRPTQVFEIDAFFRLDSLRLPSIPGSALDNAPQACYIAASTIASLSEAERCPWS